MFSVRFGLNAPTIDSSPVFVRSERACARVYHNSRDAQIFHCGDISSEARADGDASAIVDCYSVCIDSARVRAFGIDVIHSECRWDTFFGSYVRVTQSHL